MAKANKRLRSVVEGAVEATKEARRAAAAEKIRASVTTPAPAAPTPKPAAPPSEPPPTKPAAREKPARKPRRTREKPVEPEVEADTKLEGTPEQRVPETPNMSPDEAQRLRETMLQSGKPRKQSSPRPKPAPQPTPKPAASPGGFAPIRGPGALLGRLLSEAYRQAPNIAANAVAIPAFTAAGAGGVYLGTAGTVAAIRGIGKLLSPGQPQPQEPQEPSATPSPASPPDDYRTGFQRAIEQRRKPRSTDGGSDVIRALSRMRGMA